MRMGILTLTLIVLFQTAAVAQEKSGMPDWSPVSSDRKDFSEEMRISRGGQLYDNWWKTITEGQKPGDDHPLWKEQSANKRSGYSTYRCKECHGWDYRGKDGAYGKGSHYTGFVGVYDAARTMTMDELKAVLRGKGKAGHDFSNVLDDEDIADLALFLKRGVTDMSIFVGPDGAATGQDLNRGRDFYAGNCMTDCHGPDGQFINFGSNEKPEHLGGVARKNPWEFIHKVRAGQPGTRMSSGIVNGWSDDDLKELLAYAQTLTDEQPQESWFSRLMKSVGLRKDQKKSFIPESYRGFGPRRE